MKPVQRTRILAAVAATVSTLIGASMASAQYRIGQDGHANDVSNRIGSGGINAPGSPSNQLVTGNQVVTGNVTGGRQFRGGLGYTDPSAFRGILPGSGIDNFTRESAGTPAANQPAFGLDTPRAFYGDARGVAPPIGSLREGFTGSYVGTSLTPQNPYSSFLTAPAYANLDLGRTTVVGPQSYNSLQTNLLALPGSIDARTATDQQALQGSQPLGARQGPATPGSADAYVEDRFRALYPDQPLQGSLDGQTLQQMRAQLNNPDVPALTSQRLNDKPLTNSVGGQNNPNASVTPGGPTTPATPGAPSTPEPGNVTRTQSSRPLQQGLDGNRTAIANAPFSNQPQGQPLNSGTSQFQLPPPGQQSAQYADLTSRFDAFNKSHPMTAAERARQARQQKFAGSTKPGAALHPAGTTKPATGPAVDPSGAPQPGGEATGNDQGQVPLQVGSLATGIKAKGLHDLMSGAEDLMHQGKFQSAMIKYNQAERVAPNNPLIPLGRAQAELGAGYYGRAEADLRHVFTSDPAVLMGQYDLKKFLSSQRLDYLNKDLTDLAKSEARSERNWFLLAYIAYNTGDAAAASNYLSEAEKRSTPNDPVLPLMRAHWSLPKAGATTAPSTELNK